MSDPIELEPWEADDWDPLAAIMRALTAEASGTPFDRDEVQIAAELLAGVELVRRTGCTVVSIEQLFANREHVVRLAYSREDGLSIEIDWTDGEPGPQPGGDATTWKPFGATDVDAAVSDTVTSESVSEKQTTPGATGAV